MSLIREAWHNPLARAADRAEAIARVLLTAVWLCAIPVMIIVASSVWHGVSVAAESAQQSRIATTAQLLEDAPAMTADDQGVVAYQLVQVAARWVAPDGSERTGTVPAAGGRSGDRIEVWVDRSGEITPAPVPLSTSAVLIITVTVGAVLAWGALLMAAQFLIRGRLDRRRIVGWDIEWQRIEPLWSGRSRDEGAQP
jgi:hypothetical protein